MSLFAPYSYLQQSGEIYFFAEDNFSASLVFASAGFNNYDEIIQTNGLGLLPWSDVSPFIRGNGSAKTVATSSIGLFQTSSVDHWGYYDGSTFTSGSIPSNPIQDVTEFSPLVSDSVDFELGAGDFTIETWINFESLGSGSRVIAHKYVPTVPFLSAYFFQIIRVGTNQFLRFAVNFPDPNPANTEQIINSPTFTGTAPNEWQHVAVTRNGSVYRLYRNGSLIKTESGEAITNLGSVPKFRMFGTQTLGDIQEPDVTFQDYRVYKGVAKYTGSLFTPLSMIVSSSL